MYFIYLQFILTSIDRNFFRLEVLTATCYARLVAGGCAGSVAVEAVRLARIRRWLLEGASHLQDAGGKGKGWIREW
jgi:hypothetical protein